MTVYFVDSSGLVKRYIREQGTTFIRSVTAWQANHVIMIAAITPVEIVSGLMRQKREGYLTESRTSRLRAVLQRHVEQQYVSIALSGMVIQQAVDLLATYPLRAYDAVQLASALTGNAQLAATGLPALIFVASDVRLLHAAADVGLQVQDPNSHP